MRLKPSANKNLKNDRLIHSMNAYRVAQDQTRFGDQMIWRLTSGTPLRWVRVTVGEVVHTH